MSSDRKSPRSPTSTTVLQHRFVLRLLCQPVVRGQQDSRVKWDSKRALELSS